MRNLIYLLIGTIVLSCSCSSDKLDETIVTADVKANVQNTHPVFYDDGKPMNVKQKDFNKANSKAAERKGKPQRSVYLKPAQSSLRAFNGRILEQPVAYTGYTLNLPQTIDFDNDGINDEVTVKQRCYFPRTFLEVLVNGETVSYSTNYGAKILGFKDVGGNPDGSPDGFTDVIYQYGASQAYNHGEVYSEFNVGYNKAGNAVPLKDIVQSLVLSSADPSPDFIKWDLSEYGISNYTFHVYFFGVTDPSFVSFQTTTYGEWGIWTKDRLIVGHTYRIRFTNLNNTELDDCDDIFVEFTL